jgi:FkbM family methyltransferase
MIGQEEINLVHGLIPFLNPNPVIFDCGSNKAQWSDIILEEYGDNCEIYLFEPNPKLLSYTEIKYEYKKNIVFNDLAVSNHNGETNFYYFENFNNELSSLHKQDWWEGELPVKEKTIHIVKIDTYCKLRGIDYIDYLKLDLEGNEPQALEGCEKMLQEDKIRIIQIEYGGHYQVILLLMVIGLASLKIV